MVKSALAAFMLLALSAGAQPSPQFAAEAGFVTVSLPGEFLQEPVIRKQLASGLTTVFVVVANETRSDRRAGARIEIRYDLWDEVWIARRFTADGHSDRARLQTRDALKQWWSTPTRVFSSASERADLDVELRVLPFSAAEEQDAREWISKSGGVASPSAAGNFVQTLIATTITARPILTYRWRVELLMK